MSSLPGHVSRRRSRNRGGAGRRDTLIGLAFVAPAALVFATFVLYPLLQSFYLSFTDWDGVNPVKHLVGFANYRQMYHDPLFWTALRHNVIWLVLGTTVPLALGMLLAVFAYDINRGRTAFRVAFFLPFVLAPSAVAAIWGWLYDPAAGVFNSFLTAIGLGDHAPGWLGDPHIALYCVLFAGVWGYTGFAFIVLMAALQNTDRDQSDAALVDGAGAWAMFWKITLPQLRHAVRLLVLLGMISGFAVFELVFILTGGGPGESTELLATYAYRMAFVEGVVGYGSALTVVMALMALLVGVVYLQIQRRMDRT